MNVRKLALATLLIVTAGVTVVGASERPAFACSCATPTETQLLAELDATFVGVARSYVREPYNIVWSFEVERVFKGDVQNRQQVVTDHSSCGLLLDIGARYLVFARTERDDGLGTIGPGQLYGHQCLGTRAAVAGEVPEGFPPGHSQSAGPDRAPNRAPESGDSSGIGKPLVIGLAALLVGGGTAVFFLHHRRRARPS